MGRSKEPDFIERQNEAATAKKAALEKFRASAADPASGQRLRARAASATERAAAKRTREIEETKRKARDAELATEAKRDNAVQAERASAEKVERERALQAGRKTARDARYAARKARSKKGRRSSEITPCGMLFLSPGSAPNGGPCRRARAMSTIQDLAKFAENAAVVERAAAF